MITQLIRWTMRGVIAIALVAATMLGIRAYQSRSFPALEPWHTFVPDELSAKQMDAADWPAYLKAEQRILESVRTNVTDKLTARQKKPFNRYFDGSIVYPAHFAQDWNRSYVLEPADKPVGAVVLLHGLTDSPYSLRHIARSYVARGFVAVAIRLPGHGTVPAGLSTVDWEEWMAATRLAVREARRRTDAKAPLHLVGFSNGGALAVKYALDAIEDQRLARPDRIVLLSPMIGITRFARFAGLAGLPAFLPSFAKAAWLGIVPEFNPFKYNSFPVNGGRQAHRLTQVLQQEIARVERANKLADIAPILTFQSVADFTVSTPAIVTALYAHLPENGSELVLFDVNRTIMFGPLLRESAYRALERIVPKAPQRYRITVVTNNKTDNATTVVRSIAAGQVTEELRVLDVPYPPEVFSLSHVAIPFPLTDSLYGLKPGTDESFGVNLGTMVPRGERGALLVNMDFLSRIASNPFFAFVLERIEAGIDQPPVRATLPGAAYVPETASDEIAEDATAEEHVTTESSFDP